MSIDLNTERLHNEGAFYKCLSSLSHYNNVSVAMLDSLYNKNFNALVINSGFNKNNEYCLELVNLLNLKERFNYNLGDIPYKEAEHFDIGSIVTFEWDKDNGENLPKILLKYQPIYDTMGIDNLGYLLSSYDSIAQALETENEFAYVFAAMATVTDALDNMYYNFEYNNDDFRAHIQNRIAKLVKYETMGAKVDACKYMNECKGTLELVASGMVTSAVENKLLGISLAYLENMPIEYHREFVNSNFSNLSDKEFDSKYYRESCAVKGVSDREKFARLQNRLKQIKGNNIFDKLSMTGDTLSYLVLADGVLNGENYLHLLCLDSFSRDIIVNRVNIENGWSLRVGSLFNAKLQNNDKLRFTKVAQLTSNDEKERLNNIVQLKKIVDAQKKIKGLSADDKNDITEQQEFLLFALKQYCNELGVAPELKSKWIQIDVASDKKKSSLREEIYQEIICKLQDKAQYESNSAHIER